MAVTHGMIEDACRAFYTDFGTNEDRDDKRYHKMAKALDAAILSLPVSNTGEWQPIETAPKDWSDMLLYDPDYPNDHHKVFQGYYDAEENDWFDAQNVNVHPTHWRPLPEAPK